MGLRHLYGLVKLRRCGFDNVDLVAVCDINADFAAHVAAVAQSELGTAPNVYTDLSQLLSAERDLDARPCCSADGTVARSGAETAFQADTMEASDGESRAVYRHRQQLRLAESHPHA